MNDLHLIPIAKLIQMISSRQVTIREVVQSSVSSIDRANSTTNAVIWCDSDFVDSEITRVEQMASKNELPLLGIPILVKEIDSTVADTPNSYGNNELKECGFRDNITSTSVRNLQDAGAVIVGKTNNPELGLTVTTNSTAHGPCSNPLDLTRNSGGSSGGSAAAVAAGMTSVATGSDGGGSIRIPSSNCGVYGLKTTRGLISHDPFPEHPWAGLSAKGIISQSMEDLAIVLDIVSNQNRFAKRLTLDDRPLKIGIRLNGFADMYKIESSIADAVIGVADFFSSLGHYIEFAAPTCYEDPSIIGHFLNIIGFSTFVDISTLRISSKCPLDFDKLDPTTQFFYSRGSEISRNEYEKACEAVSGFSQSCEQYFDEYDILLSPTCGDIAPLHGAVESDPENAPFVYGGLCFPANMSGAPALSVPVSHKDPTHLPCGIQIMGAPFRDDLVIQLGYMMEHNFSNIFTTRSPNITNW